MRCPNCGKNNPAKEQLTYCQSCGAELRVVCPRCSADNPADEEFCRECNLELHPDRGHERPAGIRGRDLINDEEQWLSRHGQLVVGGLIAAAVLWIPIAMTLRQRSQFSTCQQHLGKMAIALRLYQRDNNSTLPVAENWTPLLLHYLKDSSYLQCPSRSARIGYAYNSYLSGQAASPESGADAIAFFEAEGGTENLAGDDTNWIKPPVHSRGNNVVLLSGAVKVLRDAPGMNYWTLTGTAPPPPAPHPSEGETKTDEPDMGALSKHAPGAPAGAAPEASGGVATVAPPDAAPGALPVTPPVAPPPGTPPTAEQVPAPPASP